MFGFRNLVVYQIAKDYVRGIYAISSQFPEHEKFGLASQLQRAAISIPSNIAEGMGRFSTKNQVNFISIAFGSLNETICQLEIAADLGYISIQDFEKLENLAVELAKLLSGVRRALMKGER